MRRWLFSAVSRARLPELSRLAAGIEFPPVSLQLDRVGTFRHAGVAWLGASQLPGELTAFRATLASALEAAGYAIGDPPWIFHVTLYRDLRTGPLTMHVDPVSWPVNRFVLMESVSGARGLLYRVRGRFPGRRIHGRPGTV